MDLQTIQARRPLTEYGTDRGRVGERDSRRAAAKLDGRGGVDGVGTDAEVVRAGEGGQLVREWPRRVLLRCSFLPARHSAAGQLHAIQSPGGKGSHSLASLSVCTTRDTPSFSARSRIASAASRDGAIATTSATAVPSGSLPSRIQAAI